MSITTLYYEQASLEALSHNQPIKEAFASAFAHFEDHFCSTPFENRHVLIVLYFVKY